MERAHIIKHLLEEVMVRLVLVQILWPSLVVLEQQMISELVLVYITLVAEVLVIMVVLAVLVVMAVVVKVAVMTWIMLVMELHILAVVAVGLIGQKVLVPQQVAEMVVQES